MTLDNPTYWQMFLLETEAGWGVIVSVGSGTKSRK